MLYKREFVGFCVYIFVSLCGFRIFEFVNFGVKFAKNLKILIWIDKRLFIHKNFFIYRTVSV